MDVALPAATTSLGESPVDVPTPTIGGPMRTRRFGVSLASIVAVALAFRVGYVLVVTRHQHGALYDSSWYYSTTIGLHLGQFFRAPFSHAPTAAHPPLTSLLLAASSFIVGLDAGTTSSLLTMACSVPRSSCASAWSDEPLRVPGSACSRQDWRRARPTSGCRAAS
jgi:hypothetical protein